MKKNQSIAFRVDASEQIGTGHLIRCLTLADKLATAGARVRFVCRHLPAKLKSSIEKKEHELVLLESYNNDSGFGELKHSHWLKASQTEDAEASRRALSGHQWDWLIVDHYALDAGWETAVRPAAAKIMVIDDIADRCHNCDALLDQNLYPNMEARYAGKVPGRCKMLLGPRYALLRDEFRRARERLKPRAGTVSRVLIFFGGVDITNCTSKAIAVLAKLGNDRLRVDVVIGVQHPYSAEIQATCARLGFDCHVQTTRMAELMASADVAIGAGGSASWERCCVGLPALAVATAENQLDIVKSLDHVGACVFLGTDEQVTEQKMKDALLELFAEPKRVAEMSMKASSLVDGIGVDRVIESGLFA